MGPGLKKLITLVYMNFTSLEIIGFTELGNNNNNLFDYWNKKVNILMLQSMYTGPFSTWNIENSPIYAHFGTRGITVQLADP